MTSIVEEPTCMYVPSGPADGARVTDGKPTREKAYGAGLLLTNVPALHGRGTIG